MPNVKKDFKNVSNVSTSDVNEDRIYTPDNKDKIIEDLSKQIELLNQKLELVNKETNDKVVEDIENSEKYNEPNPNKQVKVISLYYGELNLSTEPFGKGRLLRFSKYGEIKNVLYSTLIDIVNNNRKFAENGIFYILDKDATYFLGLSDVYKNILSKDIMDKIYDYSSSEIIDLLNHATDEQKETIVRNICDKLYQGKKVDLNKCDVIGKYCNVNIMEKVEEMKKFSDLKV